MENNNSEKNKANNKENRNNNSSWKRQTSYKRKECPIESGAVTVDYKDSRALQKFTSERGKV